MRRWILIIAFSCCLVACHKTEKNYRPTAQELRFNLHTEPPTLDPRKAIDTTSISVIHMCFEGLTRIDPTGHPTLAAAEKVDISLDQLLYTFTLRDAQWSDGSSVKAQDFEQTWKTILNPTFPSESVVDLYMIKNAKAAKSHRCSPDEIGVKALDDKTLQIELEHPVPYFLSALSTPIFFPTPTHIIQDFPDWTDGHYISNGAFTLKEWRHHDAIVLEKNPYYWDRDHVKLEKVQLLLVEDASTELSMFENNELDWAGYPLSTLPMDAMPSLTKKGILNHYMISGTYYYIFNTKSFPFTNPHLRKAFTLAINRQAIVTDVTQAGQLPAMGLIPPTMGTISPYFKDYDITEAKKLFALGLKELGITVEEFPLITLSYNTLSTHHKIAQAIQEQWYQTFGVRVKLENKEWKVFLDELRHHRFQIARMGGLASVNDPMSFLDFYRYLSSSNNYSQWTNPQFSKLLEQADQTTDAEQRMALLRDAEGILMNEMPIAPIYFYSGVYLKKPYVKGVVLNELNTLDLKWAYVECNDSISR